MIKQIIALTLTGCLFSCQQSQKEVENQLDGNKFVHVEGACLIEPDGDTLHIKGTNLGNWLNPEGYMFGFTNTNSARMINQMFCELVGPDFTADFWKQFKDNYLSFASEF